jgi:predicted HTH domain antitoxin
MDELKREKINLKTSYKNSENKRNICAVKIQYLTMKFRK